MPYDVDKNGLECRRACGAAMVSTPGSGGWVAGRGNHPGIGPYRFRWTESQKKELKKGLKKVTELKKSTQTVMKLKKVLKKSKLT